MKRRDFSKSIGAFVLSAPLMPALTSFSAAAETKTSPNGEVALSLPEYSSHSLQTNPVFVITHKGKTEVLVFDTKMKYETKAPKKNKEGFRTAEIKLEDWKGTTHSKVLGKEVSFKVTNADNSKFVADHLNQDFPGKLQLNLEFDLMAEGEVIKKGISARVNTTVNNVLPDSRTLLRVDSTSLNIGKKRDLDVVFLSA